MLSRSLKYSLFGSLKKTNAAKEIIARIKAVYRRVASAGEKERPKKIKYDKMEIDMVKYELKLDGEVVDIPPKELELLFKLAFNPNQVYTRDQLLDDIWGYEYYGDSRTIDVHIKRIRQKIDNISDQWALKTVWGVGYKFELYEN